MTQPAGPETGSVTSHAAVFGNTDPERFDRLIGRVWYRLPIQHRNAIEWEWDKIERRQRRRPPSRYHFDVPIPWLVVPARFHNELVLMGVLRNGAHTDIFSGTVTFLDSWLTRLSDKSVETLIAAQFAQFYHLTLPPADDDRFGHGEPELDHDDIVRRWRFGRVALKKEMDRLRPSIEVPTCNSDHAV